MIVSTGLENTQQLNVMEEFVIIVHESKCIWNTAEKATHTLLYSSKFRIDLTNLFTISSSQNNFGRQNVTRGSVSVFFAFRRCLN